MKKRATTYHKMMELSIEQLATSDLFGCTLTAITGAELELDSAEKEGEQKRTEDKRRKEIDTCMPGELCNLLRRIYVPHVNQIILRSRNQPLIRIELREETVLLVFVTLVSPLEGRLRPVASEAP